MDNKNVWIVITTINHPTKAVEKFSILVKERGWKLLVVGDTKTPEDWKCDNAIYLSLNSQKEFFNTIAELIPVKHYCRKNIGYLYAIKNGATAIIDTDDDNLPYEDFAINVNEKVKATLIGNDQWVNIYKYFTDKLIWPRGLSLNHIHTIGENKGVQEKWSPVQQYLADEDPDVDAIYRLLFKQPLCFNKDAESLLIEHHTYVPFNSQNTIFFKEAFALLYLPCFVSFRMTDIWRSFIVQRLLQHMGGNLVFHKATVWQERNAHSLMKDFGDEVVGYLENEKIINTLENVDLTSLTLTEAIRKVWMSLLEINIVIDKEVEIINHWLQFFEEKN